MDAKVQTILPETFKGLYVQRKRWYTGALLTVFQHRKALLSRRLGMFSGFILFNYALTLMGIVLFLSSIWLTVTKFGSEMVQYRYTHFNYFANFWHGIREYQFDVLSWSGIDLLGITAVTFTFLLVFLGLLATRTQFRGKKLAILGYPLLFFLYQLWWIVSFTAAIRGKKIKWR
jgi:cellulose synthase/poly-beta-1,6-N-acetylglucosamine synthase-like glycosyltransferase